MDDAGSLLLKITLKLLSNCDYYQTAILPKAITDCRSQIGDGFIFQQDCVSSHRSATTQNYLNEWFYDL